MINFICFTNLFALLILQILCLLWFVTHISVIIICYKNVVSNMVQYLIVKCQNNEHVDDFSGCYLTTKIQNKMVDNGRNSRKL